MHSRPTICQLYRFSNSTSILRLLVFIYKYPWAHKFLYLQCLYIQRYWICIYKDIYVCIYTYPWAHKFLYLPCLYIQMYGICIYKDIYVCIHKYPWVQRFLYVQSLYIQMYMGVWICMYKDICVCIYKYLYPWVHKFLHVHVYMCIHHDFKRTKSLYMCTNIFKKLWLSVRKSDLFISVYIWRHILYCISIRTRVCVYMSGFLHVDICRYMNHQWKCLHIYTDLNKSDFFMYLHISTYVIICHT